MLKIKYLYDDKSVDINDYIKDIDDDVKKVMFFQLEQQIIQKIQSVGVIDDEMDYIIVELQKKKDFWSVSIKLKDETSKELKEKLKGIK